MNKDMAEELMKEEVNQLAKGRALVWFLGWIAGCLFTFIAMGGWTKYAPLAREWLIHLSVNASVWLQS